MANITIPQIRSTALTMLMIFLLAPIFTAWQLHLMHELHVTTWAGFWDFCEHAADSSAWLAVGWLFVKSPFAPRIMELLTSAHSVDPSGAETDKSTKLTITGPSTDPAPGPSKTSSRNT